MPIIEELQFPPDPLQLFRRLKQYPYAFFLDSSKTDPKLGRFSILGCEPFLVFKSKGSFLSLEWADGKIEKIRGNPFLALKKILKRYNASNANPAIPFIGGGVGYFAYDLKDFVEKLPSRAEDDLGLSDCIVGFYDTAFIYDNLSGRAYLVSSAGRRSKERIGLFKERASERIIERGPAFIHPSAPPESNFTKSLYAKAVEKAKYYIKKGDIYQVNLSQRFETDFTADPLELYRRLRDFSPAPFSAYLDFDDVTILSSSPERFLLKKGNYIETRPIKGTRPRGDDAFSDSLLERELIDSHKDRAEHIMIVDLERNDLGRICRYGSVRPTELFHLEKYSTVFHLVSTVAGTLRRGVDAIDCLLATFPGGSITGAPKIRSMEIIEELEPVKRSVYTGAIGYISFDGNMDTSIVIRTFILKKDRIYFQVGGGIVADSDPDQEYQETLDKAKGMMSALEIKRGQTPFLNNFIKGV